MFRSVRQLPAGVLRLLGFMGCVAMATPSAAQVTAPADADFPIVSLDFDGYPDSAPDAPPAESPDVEARIVHSSIEAAVPWRKSTRTLLIGRATFDLVRIEMRQNALSWTPGDLYDVGVVASWDQQLSTNWWMVLSVRPHLASDLARWDLDHFNLEASLLLSGGHRGRGRYGFGATWTSIFGERLLLPMVELSWSRKDDTLRFEMLFPERVALLYRPTASIELGVLGRVEGNRYRIGEDVEFPAGTALAEPLVRYSVFTVGPVVETALSRSAFLRLEGDAALFRRLDVEDQGAGIVDLDLSAGIAVKLGLELRI